MVTADEIFAQPRARVRAHARPSEPRGSAPAELFLVDGGPATVGVIASVTRPFCGDCDRVRLTADGQVRNCLFAREESDLRAALRAGATDDELAERWVVGDARQARRPRHRRPVVPAARPADVGHRRLTAQPTSGRSAAGTTSLQEAARAQEVRQRLAVLVARQPGLAALGVCSLGLFQSSAQTARRWQPLAEQIVDRHRRLRSRSASCSGRNVVPDNHGEPSGTASCDGGDSFARICRRTVIGEYA